MRKIIFLSLIFALSSCSLFEKKPSSFEDYYKRSVHTSIQSVNETLEAIGFMQPHSVSGIFDANVSMPVLFSGAMSTQYSFESDGRTSSLMTQDGLFNYTGLTGSGSFGYKKLGMITNRTQLYTFYDTIEANELLPSEVMTTLSKYNQTWMSWTQSDVDLADPIEAQSIKVLENISTLNSEKIEKYLTQYQLWKPTADLGMSGSLHFWTVELDTERMIDLMDTFSRDMTGSGYTTEERSLIQKEFAAIRVSGQFGYDPENSQYGQTMLTFTDTETNMSSQVDIIADKSGTRFNIQDATTNLALSGSIVKTDTLDNFAMDLVESGAHMGNITAYIDHTGKKFREFGMDATVEGLTMSLKHVQNDDGTFDGRMMLPVGSLSWTGTMSDKKLTTLKVQGASPMGAMDLDLKTVDGMMRGPFVLRVGEEEIMRAIIGLQIESKKFRFVVDVPQGSGTTDMVHGELGLTFNTSKYNGQIDIPKNAKPLQGLLDELSGSEMDSTLQ